MNKTKVMKILSLEESNHIDEVVFLLVTTDDISFGEYRDTTDVLKRLA